MTPESKPQGSEQPRVYVAKSPRSDRMLNLIADMRAEADVSRIRAERGRARYKKAVARMRLERELP